MIYKEYGFELKEVSLPEGYEPLGDAEMQEQAQIHLGIGPEAFELWQKNYLSRDTRIIILSAEQAQASLRAKYPQFCQPSSSS